MVDLETVAQQLVEKPKGILAADESSGTIAKRFKEVGIEDTLPNRMNYRRALVSTPGLYLFVSGVILYKETLDPNVDGGTPVVEILRENGGIIPIIKVDGGLADFGTGEKVTKGIDELAESLPIYLRQGALATKWRAAIYIGNGTPTAECRMGNALQLTEFAKISLDNGLVPMVEPEVVREAVDGSKGEHNIVESYHATRDTLSAVFEELGRRGVDLRRIVLKTNMVTPGSKHNDSYNVGEVADRTYEVLKATVPTGVPGIAFLSGGDPFATASLNEINRRFGGEAPWNLSFSFGRELQAGPLKAYAANPNDIATIQRQLIIAAAAASQATLGQYSPGR